VLFFAATVLIAGQAQATSFTGTLDGTHVVPPVTTAAAGTAALWLNDVTLVMSFQIDYTDLQGTTAGASIHRGTEGENGPVAYPLSTEPFASGFQGQIAIDPSDLPALANGGMYVSVHTTSFPDGEIRGQIQVAQTAIQPGTWGAIKQLFK
jgi:hypothetical protein